MPIDVGARLVSSKLLEVETFRAIDRARLLGLTDDAETAIKRKELSELLLMLDLAPVDDVVIEGARSSFSVSVRALDALHVATAEVLLREAAGEPLEFWTTTSDRLPLPSPEDWTYTASKCPPAAAPQRSTRTFPPLSSTL